MEVLSSYFPWCFVLFYMPCHLLPVESYQVDIIIFISQMSKLEI